MSCTQINTYYVGDGIATDFDINFEYLEESDVRVGIYDDTTELFVSKNQNDATYGWSFMNATKIRFNTAPPADTNAPNNANIRVYRSTGVETMEATFYAGSSIRAIDLNNNFDQLRYAIEEGNCFVTSSNIAELDTRYWNKVPYGNGGDVVESTDVWIADDSHIVTTLAADNRYLSASPGPGPGINIVSGDGTKPTMDSGDLQIDIVKSTFWGQEFPNAGGDGQASTVLGDMTGVGKMQFGAGATYQFPLDDGAPGDILITDGAGNLAWILNSGGGGGGDDGAVVVGDVAALNTAAATLTVDDAGALYLVQDSTNINTLANPAVSNLPGAPDGGWSGEISVTLQWAGSNWNFIRYSAIVPDDRYVIKSGDTMTGQLTLSGPPTSNLNAATKAYVDGKILPPPVVNDSIINLVAGTNLTGGGSFTLNQASTKTITFDAAEPTFAGGEVDASITTPERTITAGAFDMSTGPYWTCGAIAIPNPTNAVSGMSGIIRITAAPTSWAGNFSTAPTPTVFPSIIPFYVQSSTSIRLGNAVGVA